MITMLSSIDRKHQEVQCQHNRGDDHSPEIDAGAGDGNEDFDGEREYASDGSRQGQDA